MEYNFKEYEKTIVPIIKNYKGIIKYSDIALETEYPLINIQTFLNKLSSIYFPDVYLDDGELIFKFPKNMKIPQEETSPVEIVSLTLSYLYSIFKFFMKFVIMIMLLIYGILAIAVFGLMSLQVLLLGFQAVAPPTKTKHSRHQPREKYEDERDGGNWSWLLSIFDFIGITGKPFYKEVHSFVFGDKQNVINFDNERNILLFIKKNKRITLSDVINLTGFSEKKAQKNILGIISKYDGDIKVSEKSGIIYYEFDRLNFKSSRGKKKFSYIWDRKLDELKLNLNKDSSNFKIVILNFLILVISASLFFFDYRDIIFISKYYNSKTFNLFFATIPLIYSTLVFLIPYIRSSFIKKKMIEVNFINEFYYLLNEFSYNIRNHYIPSEQTDNEVENFMNTSYPNLMYKDFVNNKHVINLKNYHREIYFSAKGDIKNIEIYNPDEVEFSNF